MPVASNSHLTTKQIVEKSSVSSVCRVLLSCKDINEIEIEKETFVNNETHSRTFTLCKRKSALEKEMEKGAIFRRKRFNLDGPDGFQYYFHDIRKETMSAIRRQMGGGSVIVWAGGPVISARHVSSSSMGE